MPFVTGIAYEKLPQRSFWYSAGSVVPEMPAVTASVEPPVKFWSATNVLPVAVDV